MDQDGYRGFCERHEAVWGSGITASVMLNIDTR